MEHLRLFKTESDHNNFIGEKEILTPSIHFIESEKEIKFNPAEKYYFNPDNNGYEYVDLELPSGLLWAKCNVGAQKETDYGLYFQWGDIVGYNADQVGYGTDQKSFDFYDNDKGNDGYKYSTGNSCSGGKLTKYCTESYLGRVDNKTILESIDDAAFVNLRGSWRMPTIEDFNELLDNTTNIIITVGGINGRLFTGKDPRKTLFIPFNGHAADGEIRDERSKEYLWTSILYKNTPTYSHYFGGLRIETDKNDSLFAKPRVYGMAIRGVLPGE